MTLTTHHLEFTASVTTPLELDDNAGSQLRGALVGALWDRFCANKAAPTCAACPLFTVCPVAALVAPMRAEGEAGGEQRPRPYVTRPPIGRQYMPGELLHFGLALFGHAANLFPYLVLAAQGIEQVGLGRPLAVNRGQRGRIQIEQITAVHPLREVRQLLYQRGQPQVQSPGLPVEANDVAAYALTVPSDQLTLTLRTPLRLIDNDRLVKQLTLRPLVQRLMRRLDDLSQAYGTGRLQLDFQQILALANTAQTINDQTEWVDVVSYSSRQRNRTPIGGLIGQVSFQGDLGELRELLVWGQLIHVGKNAVKGDGWYHVGAIKR